MVSASNFVSEDKGSFKCAVNGFLPSIAIIPLQSESANVSPIVKVGDVVSEGQLIASGSDICVHSSIPGIVKEISVAQYANGKQGVAVKVKLSGEFAFSGKKKNIHKWNSFEKDELISHIKDFGIVNTFKDCESLFSQIKQYLGKSKILTIRLFDDDPSRVCESFLSEKFSQKIIEGTAILAKALEVEGVVFAYEKNTPAIKKLYSNLDDENSPSYDSILELFDNKKVISVPMDVKKYPAGTMHDIVSSTKIIAKALSKKKPEYALTYSKFGSNDFFIDSQTAIAIYDALVLRIPVVNRYVHITGAALNAAAIMNVKIGTSLRQLVEQCGGLKRRLAKIIVNGVVLGYSVGSLDVTVTKMMKSVEFVPASDISLQYTENCVRCGRCRKVCPVNLWPGNIYRVYKMIQTEEFENDNTMTAILEASKVCIECGLCNTVCPSRIPLRQTIEFAKKDLK